MRDVMNPIKVYDILRDPDAAEKIAADNKPDPEKKQYASSPIRMPAAIAKPDPEETYYKGYTNWLERNSELDSDGSDGSEL